VLARVQQFLPEIEQSNTELLQRDPRSVDIEHIEETDERVIEMVSAQQQKSYNLSSGSLTWKGTKKNVNQDLGLGVFEQRRTGEHSISSSSSETSSSGSQSHATRDSSSTTDSDSSSSESEDEEGDENVEGSSPNSRPIRPLPRRVRPMIQVLSSEDEEVSSAGDHPVS
jgi:hypothetical protein